MNALTVDAGVELSTRPERVVLRLFLPGESTPGGDTRTEAVLRRVSAMRPSDIAAEAMTILDRFGPRHPDLAAMLRANAEVVLPADAPPLDDDSATVIGAVFSAEYAVEAAALCNPSIVQHPDQSSLSPGEFRVLLSLRSIGEGHISSIQFCEAIIGPDRTWSFVPRSETLSSPAIGEATWTREHFARALAHSGGTGETTRAVVQSLPRTFSASMFEGAVHGLRSPLLHQAGARDELNRMRIAVDSAYGVEFSPADPLSGRVLFPVADEERRGMEDVRLVEIADADSDADGPRYRGTFTAYDGHSIASRVFTTDDFRRFEIHRLTGEPARTKGMALFPRRFDGEWLALSRADGESTGIARSANGLDWSRQTAIHSPSELWEVVQTGNCGSPLETTAGWLVLTHGVGPMRSYSIGAILLDLEDPTRVIGMLDRPLIQPTDAIGGYVPNVVYTCGGIIHEGVLWIPHGVADQRIRVASVMLAPLLAEMTG